jgi:CheY-like chemotaxis protein
VYHVLLAEEQHLAPRIRIVRYINPDLWKVTASHAQIAQVALELATNAVDAIQDKGRVYIGTRNVDLTKEAAPLGSNLKSARYVLLSIEDNGAGMDPETHSRIFEPGFTTKSGRRGMGLTNVQNVVSASGGYISVSTIKGHGTVFRIYLPAFQERKEKVPVVAHELPSGTETILIVDDERMVLDVTQETLQRLGYHTLIAHNGAEAVELVRTHDGPIHLALLDLVMPVMGGVEAFPLLREARPDMRVIVCTGLDQEIISHEVLEDESSGFLLKPFRPSTLAQEVRKALDAKAATPKKGVPTLR